jgi:RHS repeat-associated protein
MKNVIRQALVIVLLALAVAMVTFWINKQKEAGSPLAQTLAKPSPQSTLPTPKFEGTPNRTAEAFTPLSQLPEIPEHPSDDQIVGSRLLPDRLWPMDGGASDNDELGRLLVSLRGKSEPELYAGIESWIKSHANSRWRLALQSQLMNYKWSRGYFAEARAGWMEVWKATKDRQDINAYHLGNDVLAHLLEANTGLARADVLRELVDAASRRPLNGALEGKVFRAREAVWLLEHTAAQNVMCGPLALNAIKEYRREPYIAPRLSQVPPEFQATGIPLSEVQRFAANDYKLPMKAALRTDAAQPVPTPAVMHVKDQHYCALQERSADGKSYFLEDRTLGFAGWVEKAAVDTLSSGSFLLASADLPKGFDPISATTAQTIYGRDGAHGVTPNDENVDDDDPKTDDDDDKCEGMPRYTFHPMPGAIRIGDVPLRYSPPVGPAVVFKVNYNDLDSGAPTSPPTWTNVGVTWSTNWVAWVEHVTGTLTNGTALRVRVPGGGTQVVKYNTTTAKFGPHDQSFALVSRTGTYTYTRELPDGTKQVYNSPNSVTTPTRIYLSQIIDPQGNTLTFAYDANIRLVSVTDTIGQVTTLAYTDAANIYRITRVTDPFGRFASLAYDTGGRLISVMDQLGLTSTFTYVGTNGFIATMTTPYGTSTFSLPTNSVGSNRIIEAVDPTGGKDRIEFNDTGSTSIGSLREPPTTIMVGNIPVPFYAENTRLQFRNAWYWDKLANQVAPGDYKAAKNYRFFTNQGWQVVPVVEAMKNPNEDRVWVNYPGGVGSPTSLPYYLGNSAAPEKVLRMLPDGTPQLRQTYTNAQGNLIKTVDPLGRTTEYTYAANGLDLTEIKQTTGGVNERQLAITYNAQHLPLTITDAAGSVTTYTYNARGQVLTVTNALSQVTTFNYNANGYLTSVDGPLTGAADTTSFTYDAVGRIRTTTNSDGYTRTYSYDTFDRVTQIDYPDATSEQITYDKLDRASFRDRLARVTTYTHNAVQQLTAVTDPLNRVVKMDWCRCGSLAALTDPMGRITRWQRDLEGRVVAKIYADGSKVVYDYDDATGRLLQRTDEKGQHKVYDYNVDDSVRRISYPNAQNVTPTVSYTYDSKYARMASMKDGIGTTLYAYHPITGSSTPGAGQLGSVDGPFQDDTITYSYDALGRAVSRAINGVASSITLDALGRTTALSDALGTFNFAYDGPTNRVLSMTRPNNVTTFYQYFDNSGDRRLKQIKHERVTNSSVISQFDYTHDAVGRILTWAQGEDGGTPDVWNVGYDAVDQLTSVNVTKNGSPVTSYSYTYDAAGNRLSKTDGALSTSYHYDGANKIKSSAKVTTTSQITWDAENRIISVSSPDSRLDIKYDGVGHARAIQETKSGTLISGHELIWDGEQIVEKRQLLPQLLTTRISPLGYYVATGSGTQMFLLLKDHRRSAWGIVDSTGIVSRTRYGPYGEIRSQSGMNKPIHGFSGYLSVSTFNLMLAPHRPYDPNVGRWLSRDPAEDIGKQDYYIFVGNNPIGYSDSTGLWIDTVADIGFIGYDIWNLITDPCNRDENWNALGLDLLGAVIPGATGLGAAGKAVNHADDVVDAAKGLDNLGTGFRGSKGNELVNSPFQPSRNLPGEVGGRPYSGHAFDQMQNRGIMPSVVENTVQHGKTTPGKIPGTTAHYDPVNNVTVITDANSGRVVTVGHGQIKQ